MEELIEIISAWCILHCHENDEEEILHIWMHTPHVSASILHRKSDIICINECIAPLPHKQKASEIWRLTHKILFSASAFDCTMQHAQCTMPTAQCTHSADSSTENQGNKNTTEKKKDNEIKRRRREHGEKERYESIHEQHFDVLIKLFSFFL